MAQATEFLPFAKLLKITDGLARLYRSLDYTSGIGSGNGEMFEIICELATVNQAGADGIYTILARDLAKHFAVGDEVSYWDTSAKIQYTETLTIKSIDRGALTITADGKFTAAPVTTDFLILLNTMTSTAGDEIHDYIRDLEVSDQEIDLLGAGRAIRENLKTTSAIHPLIRSLISSINSHYTSGIDGQVENHTDPVISFYLKDCK